ncbi:MAG: glycoside hydrolase family 9 protein [Asticcacaulis sp.]|nr:glycoside hydrolase family 9 protein [Asticcacaulis sp.]
MKSFFVVLTALLSALALPAAADGASPTPFIVVDQFGYLPNAQKVAVIRDPEVGFDSDWDFTPGAVYQVVDTTTGAVVYEAKPFAWNHGAVDPSSGDHAWLFDFSMVTAPGHYLIRDKQAAYDSYGFEISYTVYKPILVAATRAFYYQRAGFPKDARFAGEGWADQASHLGPGQDGEARLYSAKGDKSTERDLRGGWYDAGDFNKYTSWTANYVVGLLSAYSENPEIWSDDFNIPESGNGLPDILDEVKYGLDWLVRMQNNDGGVLSIVGLSHASPPSAAKGPSYYGPATTSASYASAAAFAYGAKIYAGQPGLEAYAADLRHRAVAAWTWAQAHPDVTFYNNDAAYGSEGVGAGQQETDDYGRAMKALGAAIYLYDLTGEAQYRDYVDGHYSETHLFTQSINLDFDYGNSAQLLYYAQVPGATAKVARAIRDAFTAGFAGDIGWGAQGADPYNAWITAYGWGSSATKGDHGNIFADEARYGLYDRRTAMDAAAGYIHYLHGVNPLGKVYLSNMKTYGAESSVDKFYHTWYAPGTVWDSVSGSKYGPPPGYLVGGANPGYSWDRRCPQVSPKCGAAMLSPPVGQPDQKAYADFNQSWPVDSWEVTENSGAYQTAYIRLLARFVR